MPDWDMGLNLGLDHVRESPNWFSGVESLVGLLEHLNSEMSLSFELFVCYRSPAWLQEHLAFVSAKPTNLNWLKNAIERLTRYSNQ